MAEPVEAVFNTSANALRFLPEDGEPQSIRDWIISEKKPGSILFTTCNHVDLELNRSLLIGAFLKRQPTSLDDPEAANRGGRRKANGRSDGGNEDA